MNPLQMIRKALTLDWKGMTPLIHAMAKESGRSRLNIFRDMIKCYQTGGYTWESYTTFGFHLERDPAIRATFLSQGEMDILATKVNTPETSAILNDKGKFYRHFKPYLKREFLDLREDSFEDFSSFLDRHEVFFIKPPAECGGKGVERKLSAEIKDRRDFFDRLLAEERFIVEEAIVQNAEMSKLSVNSVNTLRIGTCVNQEGVFSIPYALLRCSVNDSFVDNGSQGGGFTLLDEKGVIRHPLTTNHYQIKYVDKNEATGFNFIGFQIPHFEEAKQMVLEAHKTLPGSLYIGWDIAISDKGPVVVEGNTNPGTDLYQHYRQVPDGRGAKARMEKALGIKVVF